MRLDALCRRRYQHTARAVNTVISTVIAVAHGYGDIPVSRKFGYVRVSSDGQDLTAQREALRAAGCDIIREEKVSGGSTVGREQLAILLDFIAEGDTLVVTKLDRLARSTLYEGDESGPIWHRMPLSP